MSTKEAMKILRTCREMLARSNSSEHASPVLFRACLCSHGWLAACTPIPATNQRMVHREGDEGGTTASPLTGGPLVPLSAVLVLLCVGVVVLVYAYRQQARRRRSESVDPRDSEEVEEAARPCRAPPPAPPVVALRAPLPGRHHLHRTYDPPPAYLSVIAEEPPSYETACSDEQLDKLGHTTISNGVS
ncbi:uncharacterized protein LOC122370081 [Amphibalanus amphitrite]|uniref:uncharacterized protein LOC122370081 n=1 Tax=Amphibalanus amphitrite TaxID=1232801 RepID=UPI001C9046A7|nr:uncharacterized protein LOC122370081 [Amphibalanus amphitrite]